MTAWSCAVVDCRDGAGDVGSSDPATTTSMFCYLILLPRTRMIEHEDGAGLLERPDLGFSDVGDLPSSIYIAMCDDNLR